MSASASRNASNESPCDNSSPSTTLQAALDAERVEEASYDRKIAAIAKLQGMAVKVAEALNTVDPSSFVSELGFSAEEWEKVVEMCDGIMEVKREKEGAGRYE